MATFGDIGLAAGVNILSALIFLIAFAVLWLQPFNDRVYFPKWYLKGLRSIPTRSGAFVSKFVNLDWRSYIRFLNWVLDALKMPEAELIDHAGLDSAIYLRIYLLGLKIFVPVALLAWAILVPINWTNSTLAISRATDKLEYLKHSPWIEEELLLLLLHNIEGLLEDFWQDSEGFDYSRDFML